MLQMKRWMETVPEVGLMMAAAFRRHQFKGDIWEFVEEHEEEFDTLYEAIVSMEDELPRPQFPWPEK